MNKYNVLYRDETIESGSDPLHFICFADDEEHAIEQVLNAYPDATIENVILEYGQQADDLVELASTFATKHNVKLTIISEDYRPYFPDDKESRSVYKCQLTRTFKDGHKNSGTKRRNYTFFFGQSIVNAGIKPTMYDVLACLTKSDPESFENFCSSYGYDNDSRTAERTYKAVLKEWKAVDRLFGDVLDELSQIA